MLDVNDLVWGLCSYRSLGGKRSGVVGPCGMEGHERTEQANRDGSTCDEDRGRGDRLAERLGEIECVESFRTQDEGPVMAGAREQGTELFVRSVGDLGTDIGESGTDPGQGQTPTNEIATPREEVDGNSRRCCQLRDRPRQRRPHLRQESSDEMTEFVDEKIDRPQYGYAAAVEDGDERDQGGGSSSGEKALAPLPCGEAIHGYTYRLSGTDPEDIRLLGVVGRLVRL